MSTVQQTVTDRSNPNCDSGTCTRPNGEVRKLFCSLGVLYLCRECFDHEMNWRREINHANDGMPGFDILEWHDLPVAHAPRT